MNQEKRIILTRVPYEGQPFQHYSVEYNGEIKTFKRYPSAYSHAWTISKTTGLAVEFHLKTRFFRGKYLTVRF